MKKSKKIRFIILLIAAMVLAFSGCSYPNNKPSQFQPTGPTGDGNNIDQPHVFYNNGLYAYYATGFDEDFPEDYELVGQIRTENNSMPPAEELAGCQVDVGQNVYAHKENPESIYVEYETGYALFTLKKRTSN